MALAHTGVQIPELRLDDLITGAAAAAAATGAAAATSAASARATKVARLLSTVPRRNVVAMPESAGADAPTAVWNVSMLGSISRTLPSSNYTTIC